MDIQWFPGHMTKTRRMIEEDIKSVDCVLEILDARCPVSSRNPDLPSLTKGKPIVTVINKSDIADEKSNLLWKDKLNAILISSKSGMGVDKIAPKIKELLKEKIERDKKRGIVNKPIRIMVCGIPNVGKSSLINKLSKKGATKVGDRPGVTRGKQWVTLKSGIEMLDTPGILWPKFEDKSVGLKLAFTGAIKDDIMNVEELASSLCDFLRDNYGDALKERYSLSDIDKNGYDILFDIAKNRSFFVSNGEADIRRASNVLLDEFRASKLGRITLD